jgi:hypothetical protein
MEQYLRDLDENLIYDSHETTADGVIIRAHLRRDETRRRHSKQMRIVRDLPYGGRKVTLYVEVGRYFAECGGRRTEMERLSFVSPTRRRTKRLDDSILKMQREMGAIGCERMIRPGYADVSDSTILRIVKKKSASSTIPDSPPSA